MQNSIGYVGHQLALSNLSAWLQLRALGIPETYRDRTQRHCEAW